MRRTCIAISVCTTIAGAVFSTLQATAPMSATTFTLPNGLTVVVSEEHSTPNVAVELWIRAGARYEEPGHWGQAHFFEHMFAATRVRPSCPAEF